MKKLYPFILLAFLVACSDMPLRSEKKIKENKVEDQIQSAELERWDLKSRLSLSSEKGNGTVTFLWTQDQDRYHMRFIMPFGRGSYILKSSIADGAYLLTAKNEVFYADDAETLLKQSIGWHVPLSGFKYWVRGLPEPGVELIQQQYDGQGRVVKMQQADWEINIKRYMKVDGIYLPAKIFMHNAYFTLKLVIQTWDTSSRPIIPKRNFSLVISP